MRVVVTGATGNIGTALLRRLGPDPEWELLGLARRVPEHDTEPYRHADWVACDLGDESAADTLRRVLAGADAVVHLAWAIHPRRDDPPMWRTNVTGTRRLLAAVADTGTPRLVAGSSVAAYSPAPRWSPVSEDWPRGGIPRSAYSRGKVWLEHALDEFAVRHPDTAITRVRPCAVVQHDAAGEFTRWMLGALIPPTLLGRPWTPVPMWSALRAQVVHADDVATAIAGALRRDTSDAVNLASESVLRSGELASILGGARLPAPRPAVAALLWPAWRCGLHPVHPSWLTLLDRVPLVDITHARATLGWTPQHDARDTLAELVSGIRHGAGIASAALAPVHAGSPRQRLRAVPWDRPTHQSQA